MGRQGFIHIGTMQSYPLNEIPDRQHEVLDQAMVEPVLLTTEAQPNYVLLAVDRYQQLIDLLTLLEDCAFGQLAQKKDYAN